MVKRPCHESCNKPPHPVKNVPSLRFSRSFHPVSLKEGECEELTTKERARARIQVEECWDAAKKDGTFGRGYERAQKQFS